MIGWLRRGIVAVAVLLLHTLPTPAPAQTRADSAAVILATAQRLDAEGRAEAASTLFEWLLEHYGDTPAASTVRALRAQSSAAGDVSGRVELQIWSALYGAWLGIAVPVIASADGPEPYGAGLLLGAPIGYFSGRAYARSRSLSVGQARAITWGGTWGTWHGFAIAEIADIGASEPICFESGQCFEDEDTDPETIVAAGVVGGLAGIVGGALFSRRPISPGVGTALSYGSLWGTWIGLASGVIGDLEGDDLMLGTLIGGDIGLIGATVIAERARMTRTRARLISIGGVLGGLAGAGILLLADASSDDAIAIPLAGSLLGLGLGAAFTSDRTPAPAGQPGGAASPLAQASISPALVRSYDESARVRPRPGFMVRIPWSWDRH